MLSVQQSLPADSVQELQMSQLTINLFGEFYLALDGKPIHTIQPGRQQTLLAYLVLHRTTPLSRRRLAFLFWPDSNEMQAHANLRQLLHHIRHGWPGIDPYLQLESRTLQWRPEQPFTLDLAEFERWLEEAAAAERTGDRVAMRSALEQAVDLYRGDLLFSCYDDWVLLERERWRERFITTLDRLIVLLEELRDYPAAIVCAQRLLRHDPLHEVTYRRLMTLYAANGERASALRTYHSCVTALQRELEVEPQTATQELYARLLELTGQPAGQPAPNAATNRLVGRQAEWARLQSLWRAVLRGQSQVVLVYGEAGIGKSRLLEELLHWAGQQGVTTAQSRSYAAEGALAYAPVIDWLRSEALQAALPKLEPAWRANWRGCCRSLPRHNKLRRARQRGATACSGSICMRRWPAPSARQNSLCCWRSTICSGAIPKPSSGCTISSAAPARPRCCSSAPRALKSWRISIRCAPSWWTCELPGC